MGSPLMGVGSPLMGEAGSLWAAVAEVVGLAPRFPWTDTHLDKGKGLAWTDTPPGMRKGHRSPLNHTHIPSCLATTRPQDHRRRHRGFHLRSCRGAARIGAVYGGAVVAAASAGDAAPAGC